MSYYQGNTVHYADDAINYYASWTADELADLRDFWRMVDLRDIAMHLGRSESACRTMYYFQRGRPRHERWTPPARERRGFDGESVTRHLVPDQRVRTIHADEELWWEPDFYR